jgi:hypothetical protein
MNRIITILSAAALTAYDAILDRLGHTIDGAVSGLNKASVKLAAADARAERKLARLDIEVSASFARAKAVENAEFEHRVDLYVSADDLATQRERAARVRGRIDELLA